MKTDTDNDIVFDYHKDFPFVHVKIKTFADIVWINDLYPANSVKISTMTPSVFSPSSLHSYSTDMYVLEEDNKLVEKLLNQFPADFIENLKTEMKDYREKNGRFLYSVLVEIRLIVNKRVLEITNNFQCDQKHKNLILGIIRFQVGQFVDDIGGD